MRRIPKRGKSRFQLCAVSLAHTPKDCSVTVPPYAVMLVRTVTLVPIENNKQT